MPGVPYIFGNATTAIPLTQLDANFNTTATLGNTAVGLGNTTTTVGNLTLNNVTINSGTINSAVSLSGNVTIGNTTVGLGNTATTVGNLTLTNTTVTNYTETLSSSSGGNVTISLVNGTYQNVNVNATITITLPNSVAGKSFTVQTYYTANNTFSWAGGTTLKWAGNTAPTPTATSGKVDIFNFYQDGNVTYGAVYGQNF
jgi:hypothetical protein